MQVRLTLIAVSVLLATVPALTVPVLAAQITQILPAVQDLGDFTPFNLAGTRFNPAIGTLTAVTGELKGTVTATTFLPLGTAATTRQTTRYFVFTPNGASPGPNSFAGSLADQTTTPTVTSGGATYKGTPAAVDLVFNFGALSEFIGLSNSPTLLAEFGFQSGLPDFTGSFGGASDLTLFNGTFNLTYTYFAFAVPEPASLALVCGGLVSLLAMRGRRIA